MPNSSDSTRKPDVSNLLPGLKFITPAEAETMTRLCDKTTKAREEARAAANRARQGTNQTVNRDDPAIASRQTMTSRTLPPKRRGRPQTISDEKKRAAQAVKDGGGTNMDAAKVLYNEKRPSPQHVKNVPTILKHFKKKNRNN